MKNPADIKAAHITANCLAAKKLPLKSSYILLLKAVVKITHNKLTNLTGLLPRPTITLLYSHHDHDPLIQ